LAFEHIPARTVNFLQRGLNILEGLFQDLRYAVRQFIRARGFTTIAVLAVALGIGATTSTFSVVYGVLLDPYPYKDANRIVYVEVLDKGGHFSQLTVTGDHFDEIRNVPFVEDAFFQDLGKPQSLTSEHPPSDVQAVFYTSGVFRFLGVEPLLGRVFTPADMQGGIPAPVAVLSYRFWQEHYFGNREVLGKTIEMDHVLYSVIGVMPPRFTWTDSDVYLLGVPTADPHHYWMGFVKLKPGANVQAAEASMQTVVNRLAKEDPNLYGESARVKIVSLNEDVLGSSENIVLNLFAAAVVLLIIGCANVSILVLARGIGRQREFAVRTSLGAGRLRVMRQLLTEAVLLSLAGAALGVLAAWWGLNVMRNMLPYDLLPHEADIRLNVPVLLFSTVVALITGVLVGVLPAFVFSRLGTVSLLRSSGTSIAGGGRTRRLHRLFIGGQVAAAMLLLAGAGAATKALFARLTAPLGFDPDHVVSLFLDFPELTASSPQGKDQESISKHEIVRQAMSETPGVTEAGFSFNFQPAFLRSWMVKVEILSKPSLAGAQADFLGGSPELISLLRIPVLRGRTFTNAEVRRQAHVAVVNQAFWKQYMGDVEPIGQSVRLPILKPMWGRYYGNSAKALDDSLEVIGVIGDFRNDALNRPIQPAVYCPYSIFPAAPGPLYFVRASGDPQNVLRSVKARLREVNPEITVREAATLQSRVEAEGWARERLIAQIFASYAVIALVLTATGLYGVVSFAVSQRTQELGIRMALGAQRGAVLRHVLTSTAAMLGVGIVAGLIINAILAPLGFTWIGSGSSQPLILLGAAFILVFVATTACVVPALRAVSINPVQALRIE
jgi:predicted permease